MNLIRIIFFTLMGCLAFPSWGDDPEVAYPEISNPDLGMSEVDHPEVTNPAIDEPEKVDPEVDWESR